LFVNPGGLGGSGTSVIPRAIRLVPAALQARFDVVSWNPRGVGESTAVQCFASTDDENTFLGGWDPRSSRPNLTGVNRKVFGGGPGRTSLRLGADRLRFQTDPARIRRPAGTAGSLAV
jgi:pimeloyl-ACP methyl ester carboxylesterase